MVLVFIFFAGEKLPLEEYKVEGADRHAAVGEVEYRREEGSAEHIDHLSEHEAERSS